MQNVSATITNLTDSVKIIILYIAEYKHDLGIDTTVDNCLSKVNLCIFYDLSSINIIKQP